MSVRSLASQNKNFFFEVSVATVEFVKLIIIMLTIISFYSSDKNTYQMIQ